MLQLPIDPAKGLQAFYLLITIAAFTVYVVPFLSNKFLHYGSRNTPAIENGHEASTKQGQTLYSMIEKIAGLQVPHSWFIHFYIVSVVSSIFWAHQIINKGPAFTFLALQTQTEQGSYMTINQVAITGSLWALQGARRLFECITLKKPSKAMMPVPTWAIGVLFYLSMGVSIWIEGILPLTSDALSVQSLQLAKPSMKTYLALPLFVLASGIQHDCHEHLSNLKKYSLPDHQFFHRLLCPHYTSESIIYLSLAIVSAPSGQYINRTITMAWLFTTVNLGLTAESSKIWYEKKFGDEKIKGRWRMVPFVY